jgi:hypothetical protein
MSRKVHIVIAGRARDPQIFENFIKALSLVDRSDHTLTFTTWKDEIKRWQSDRIKEFRELGCEILVAEDGYHLDSPGNYFRQVYLLKNAARHLVSLGNSENDLVLKIRPDLIFKRVDLLAAVSKNLKATIRSDPELQFWTIHCDLLEPFYACDIMFAAPIKDILKLENQVVVEHGHAQLIGEKNSYIRIEASLFSRLLDYKFSRAYLELVNSRFYGEKFNIPEFRFRLLMLLKNKSLHFCDAYKQTLDDWHTNLLRVKVGFPIIDEEVWLYRHTEESTWRVRSLYLQASNVNAHFAKWVENKEADKFFYEVSHINLVCQDLLKKIFIDMYKKDQLEFFVN